MGHLAEDYGTIFDHKMTIPDFVRIDLSPSLDRERSLTDDRIDLHITGDCDVWDVDVVYAVYLAVHDDRGLEVHLAISIAVTDLNVRAKDLTINHEGLAPTDVHSGRTKGHALGDDGIKAGELEWIFHLSFASLMKVMPGDGATTVGF